MPQQIRKQVYELTPEDLVAFSAWQFALHEESEADQDEATVRPFPFSGPIDPAAGMLIVAARFWLADGTEMRGYLTPPTDEDRSMGRTQPQIVTPTGQVCFWYGRCPPNTARAYGLLGRPAHSVFPVRFESAVPLVGGAVSGSVAGFLCLEDDLQTVRTIK